MKKRSARRRHTKDCRFAAGSGCDQRIFIMFGESYVLNCREVSGSQVSIVLNAPKTSLPSCEDVEERCLAACAVASVDCLVSVS